MRRRVVITGLGCVSPLGNTVAATWASAAAGRSGIATISRFDPAPFRSRMAGEVKDFDPGAVLDPAERETTDAFAQYALVAAQEAMDDAGLTVTDELAPLVGVTIGAGLGGLTSIERAHTLYRERGEDSIPGYFMPAVLNQAAADRIAARFNCGGYSASISSACSSSNHSIGNAARLIERGDAVAMLAGGTEATVTPLGIGGFAAMHALSTRNDDPARASRPYDANRDGFVLGEGAGILVLEEYEFANARGAHIYCELAGYGYSGDAFHMTTPSTDGPRRAMCMALRDAEANPEEVDYINTHGTSTPAGDINELLAVKLALGNAAKRVSLSSTKSMSGHLLSAAGALEAVISVKALEHQTVPPTVNIETLDRECDLDVTPGSAKSRPLRVAMSNSFGFGGTNATLVFRRV